jgi:hypothetical protein
MAEVAAFTHASAVVSFNTRIGAVTLTAGDVDSALGFTPYNVTNPAGYQTAAQVTTSLAPYAPLAGATFTGPVDLAADPTVALGAATKQYVDAHTPAGGASITVSDTAPASPASGALWWDSVGGQMYIWYVDPNSSQWVAASSQAVGTAGGGGVTSWNTRTGAVVLSSGDVTTALTFTPYNATNPSGYQTAAQVTTAVAPALNNVGRNLLHNGLFNVAQRGTGPWTASGYTLDRWNAAIGTDAASFTQTAMSDGQRAQIGDEASTYCLSNVFTGNAAAGALNAVLQRIEGVRRLTGKSVTVSFYASASATQKLGVSIDQHFGTGGSPSADVIGAGVAVQLTGTWARYSLTFTLPSVAGKILGTNGDDFTVLWFWYSSGATNATRAGNIGVQSGTVQIWGAQLEISSVATPLEKLDPADDLRHAQRFFQVGSIHILGYATVTGVVQAQMQPFPVTMRGIPAVTPNFTTQTACTGTITNADPSGFEPYSTSNAVNAQTALHGTFTASADL